MALGTRDILRPMFTAATVSAALVTFLIVATFPIGLLRGCRVYFGSQYQGQTNPSVTEAQTGVGGFRSLSARSQKVECELEVGL